MSKSVDINEHSSSLNGYNSIFERTLKEHHEETIAHNNPIPKTILETSHLQKICNEHKRPVSNIVQNESKKLKFEESSHVSRTETKPCEEILQNTLDSLNITNLLQTKTKNSGFDAFASYLKEPSTPINNDNKQSNLTSVTNRNIENKNHENINELIKRQVLAKESYRHDSTVTLKSSCQEKTIFKEPTQTNIDMVIGPPTISCENENISLNYRKEVYRTFEQIENSICAIDVDNVPEDFLDEIFRNDFNESLNQQENTEKSMKSQINGSTMNLSFATFIRKALIQNSTKNLIEKRKQIQPLNLSFMEAKPTFLNLGPFYGLPVKVKDLIKQYRGIEELYDWQEECLKLPQIENKENLIYALPTSGGKTLVAEILMFRELMCYKRNALFILPYVSIVQEKVWTLSPFGVALDFLVEEYASSKGVYPPRRRRRKNSIYVATIEKALGLINSLIEMGRLTEIGLIVVDELHLIGEEGRGATLEACLSKIIFLKANVQIIGMSATIGNVSDLCKFLNAVAYIKNFRPVELLEYVKCNKRIAKINWNYTNEEDLLVDHKTINYKYSDSTLKLDPDMLGGLVMEVIPDGSCLIFCASKKNCENVATLLCKLCKPGLKDYKKIEKEQIMQALRDEGGTLCDILAVSVEYGIAYHHSGLTSDERRIIEEGFRAGVICIICCTSTLSAGVNLPAKRVILRSPYIGKNFINMSRYKQMVGRAGRAGLRESGESILIAQPQDLPKVMDLLMSPMSNALSSMHLLDGRGLRHLLLSCISLGIANTRLQLQEVATHTLLAVQKDQLDVNIENLADKVIKNLFKLGALKEYCVDSTKPELAKAASDVSIKMDESPEDSSHSEHRSAKKQKKKIVLTHNTRLVVSQLGCAAIKSGLELSRAHILYEDLYEAQSSLVLQNHLHLLYLVTPYETADQIKPNKQIYFELFNRLNPIELKVAKTIGINESVAVKMLSSNNPIKTVPERVLNRFYLTLMLYDLWSEMSVFQVSEKYQINRGIVQNLMTSAATFASNVVNFCEELEEFWAYSFLLKGMAQRLAHCCVKELVPLMELPSVKQSRAKQLYNAGFKTLQSIAKANVNDLVENVEFMSNKLANQLIAASKMLLLERVENLREEAEDILGGDEAAK